MCILPTQCAVATRLLLVRWMITLGVAGMGLGAVLAQDATGPSPFPESSLKSIDPVEALPPPLDDDEPFFPNLRPSVAPPTPPAATRSPGATPSSRDAAQPEDLPEASEGDGGEIVRQRYPSGRVRVERHVALDEQENYVNHGPYHMYDPNGVTIAEGKYHFGEAEGPWRRWVATAASPSLQKPPYSSFQGPFLSIATFREGKLHGVWLLSDRMKRKVFEIEFQDGLRHGKAVWFFPSGGILREAYYADGLPHGAQRIWATPGGEPKTYRFEDGRRVELQVAKHPNQQKRSEGLYYHPKLSLKVRDDWWALQLAEYESVGEGYRQGQWRVWHSNGQLQMRGEYELDKPVGAFSWWHPNGQLALQGKYFEGRRDGRWLWWHANGLKRSQGEYYEGNPTGDWAWWDDDGKLSRQADFPGRLRNLEEEFPVERSRSAPATPTTLRQGPRT